MELPKLAPTNHHQQLCIPAPLLSSFVFLRRSLPVDTTGTILWEPPSTLEFDGSQLQPGTYLVELMLGQQRNDSVGTAFHAGVRRKPAATRNVSGGVDDWPATGCGEDGGGEVEGYSAEQNGPPALAGRSAYTRHNKVCKILRS